MFACDNTRVDMMTETDLIRHIEAFLDETGMPPTRFGRDAAAEPAFLARLKKGLSPTLARTNRVLAFIADYRAKAAADHDATDTAPAGTVSPDNFRKNIGAAA